MSFYVYMLINKDRFIKKTYVGYTIDIKKRLKQHNTNKGAKSTKGYSWELIYIKKFLRKKDAMKYEYKLKKDRKLRKKIKESVNEKTT